MTNLSPRTASPLGSRPNPEIRLRRLIARARASIAAERILPALWPALGFAGAYLGLALTGLYAFIPWPAQALLLAATITATGLSLESGFENIRWPDWRDGARRLERDSALLHRPISESQDQPIGEDPFALELWRLHRARVIPLAQLRGALPHPDLTQRDPRRLRYLVLLLVVAGLMLAGAHGRQRLVAAFDSGAGLSTTLDAWIDPPAYTGLPPVYLAAGDTSLIAVPAGSILNLRAHNAPHAPGLAFGQSDPPRFTGANGEYTNTARIDHDAHVRVRSGGHRIGAWRLRVIADALPVIAFAGLPAATEHKALNVTLRASDDYGVTGARIIITPHGRTGAPLVADLPLPPGKAVTQSNYLDLTGHPYAGLEVDAYLEARDGAGQTGRSASVRFRLPARVFTDPLARALIEQRQNLATSDAAGRGRVAATLDALAIAPDRFYDGKTGIYVGLRAAYWGLRTARVQADVTHVQDLLWQMAVSLEQNGLLDAAAELRRLQALLTAAMISRAPQDVIDELLQRYNQAMQRYMQAMANNPGAAPPPAQDQNTRTVTQKDIEDLIRTIQQLSASGNREQAAQMLAVLQNMLENMKMAQSGQGGQGNGNSPQNKALNDAIQKFGDLMGQQRSLLDKTMRQQNGNGDPKEGGPQGLANQQRQLRDRLNQTMKSMDPKLGQKLGPAGSAMDRAGQSLGQKNLGNAGNEQKNALDALRQGAEALAKQAASEGQRGETQNDPLGRGKGSTGNGVKLPGAADLARAREILQELRKRAGERGRPQEELNYIDRLLKEF